MIKSNIIYSPQTFIEALTDKCYFFDGENVVGEIKKILRGNQLLLKDYEFQDIDTVVKDKTNVVLVDVSGFDGSQSYKTEFRWFEVPYNFTHQEVYNGY